MKEHSQFIKKFYRECGHYIAIKFKNTRLTANGVTILRIPIIILVSVFILTDVYLFHVAAAFLIIIFSMFDALDGSLATIKNERSVLGSWLDPQVDRLGFLILFIIISYYLSNINEGYIYLTMYTLNMFYFRGLIPADIRLKDKFILLREGNHKDLNSIENNKILGGGVGLTSVLKKIHLQISPHTHNVALYIAIGLVFNIVEFIMVYLAMYISLWYLWESYKVIMKAINIDERQKTPS
jgi:phosphatidylglycerophosphate synthase